MKKLVLGILSSLILTTNVLANEIETKKVISTGVGLTESEALKDTTRNAVQQVVGAYILSDTYVKNSQLIKDEILINSNGFVKSFKIISQTKDSNGLVKIEAEVEVEPSNVTKRLGELNIALKDVATTEFKAISLDKFQAVKDFKTMFDEIVLKPIKENKQIYDIKIGELKSIDKLPDYFGYFADNKDPALMPFILTFSVTPKKEYIDSIKSFLEKSSLAKYDYFVPSNLTNYDNTFLFVEYLNWKKEIKNKHIYQFDEKIKNSYNNLVKEVFDAYMPVIYFNFKDSSNNIIKPLRFYLRYYLDSDFSSNESDISKIRCKECSPGIFAIYPSNNNKYIQIYEGKKDRELGIYLNENEISQIKGASIEMKWEKK